MKKVIITLVLMVSNLFATNGEFFLQVNDVATAWILKVEKIPGEFYYDQYYNIANPPDYQFSKSGYHVIRADFVFGDENNGSIDDFNRDFVLYYGKYKLTIGGSVFYLNYLDCD